MKINWQAYHDRSMAEADRQAIEHMLESDKFARAEYDAFLRFLSDVKQAGLSEHVPGDKLRQSLASVAGEDRAKNVLRLWPAFTAAAACLMAIMFFNFMAQPQPVDSDFHLDKSPQVAALRTDDATESARWISSRLGYGAPAIKLASTDARLEGAECGYCWMAYDFVKDGQHYKIYGRKETGGLTGLTPFKVNGKVFYESKNGIGWYCVGGMTYWIVGGTREGRKELATTACQSTMNLVDVQS
ncbi:hypothetical protein QPK87_01305 [Kamptonema cortianum]|nr:hypothetical protein [Geitlerinema splendidum]MDK3155225.1 hypothetical protein [Kamptonema cortianum]